SPSPATAATHAAVFSLPCAAHLPALHSFPTRRSSDLALGCHPRQPPTPAHQGPGEDAGHACNPGSVRGSPADEKGIHCSSRGRRSEEHTSELQSRFDLVCRLLLEKKKEEKCASGTHRT